MPGTLQSPFPSGLPTACRIEVIHLIVDRRWLNFLTATETQLEALSQACTPATFGMDNKDVMDLSYRKAGKMDTTDFIARFDPERLGLSEFVRGELLEGDEDKKGLRTELYKLNVYGQWCATPCSQSL